MMGAALLYMNFVAPPVAHVAELVPEGYAFGICYASVEDLRDLYADGPYTRNDFDPARRRIGEVINVPEFDGVNLAEPVAVYWKGDETYEHQIVLVPFTRLGDLEAAFEVHRENLKLRHLDRVAQNYVALRTSREGAEHGPLDRRIEQAAAYPAAVVGHPSSARTLRAMLVAFFGQEARRHPQGGPPRLMEQLMVLPARAGDVAAAQCRDLLIGCAAWRDAGDAARFDVRAALREGCLLERARPVAGKADLAGVLKSFPVQTLILAGAALDGAGWKELGLPLALEDGVFAFGIVDRGLGSRGLTLLVAARPEDPAGLAGLDPAALLDEPAPLRWAEVDDGGTKVRTAKLGEPPEWLATVLRSDQRTPPPVYLSVAVEEGVWYAAVGRWAEAVVRDALGCRRGAAELSVQAMQYAAAHKGLFDPGHAAAGFVTPQGLKRAFEFPMPLVEMAALGQPKAVTFTLDVEDEARGEIRLHHR